MRQHKILEWKIRAKYIEYKKRIKGAITIIKKAKNMNLKFIISWSGGKDSTAMVHIIKNIWPECPIITQFDDCDWPEKRKYIYSVANCFKWDVHEVVPDFSVWKYFKDKGIKDENICSKNHYLTKYGFLKPLEDKRKELGCAGAFIGLRKQESNRRKRNYKYNGNLYKLKSGEYICTPIIHLEVEDVFAYLVSNHIDINPCYFNNTFNEPENIRLSWFLPSVYNYGQGHAEYMRKYYPELYNKFRELDIFT